MELASALPAELLTLSAPQIGGATGLQRPSAATKSDDSAVAGAFDMLLQLMGVQLPAGQPLPASGSNLPPATGVLPTGTTPQSNLAAWLEAAATQGAAAPTAVPGTDGAVPGTAADALRAALTAARQSAAQDPAAGAANPALPPLQDPTAAAQALDPTIAAALEAALPAPSADAGARPRLKAGVLDSANGNASRVAATLDAQRAAATATDPTADVPPPIAIGDASAAQLKAARFDEPAIVLQTSGDTTSPISLLGHGATHGGASATGPASATAPTAPAAPALPQAPVDTQAARWHEALASRVHWLVDHDVGEARIKLNPPELGALDVKISMQDDKTFVQMTAHSAAARDELSQHLPRLRELLSAGGLDLGGATVSGGHDERGARQQGTLGFARPIDDIAGIDADAPVRRARGNATIDTFA